MISAFAGLVVGKVFDERRAQWLERLARGLQVFRLGQGLSLLGDLRREHFHLIAFDGLCDGVGVVIQALHRIFRKFGLNRKVVVEDRLHWLHERRVFR